MNSQWGKRSSGGGSKSSARTQGLEWDAKEQKNQVSHLGNNTTDGVRGKDLLLKT